MTWGQLPEPDGSAEVSSPAGAGRPAAGVRLLDGLAGLLAAGVLLVGLLLLVAALLAPTLLSTAELGPADGPGWGRVIAHLGVGVAGELVVRFRRYWPAAGRVGADCAVILAAVVLLWWAWWP